MSDKGKKSTGSTGSGGLKRSDAQRNRARTSTSSTNKKQDNPSKLDTGAAAASAAKQSDGTGSKLRIDDVMTPSLSGPSAAELKALGMPGSLSNVASPTIDEMSAALARDQAMKAVLQKAPEKVDKTSGKK